MWQVLLQSPPAIVEIEVPTVIFAKNAVIFAKK